MRYFIAIVIVVIAALNAEASLSFGLDGYLSTDTSKNSVTTSDSKSCYSLDLLTNLDNNKRFYAGFHVGQVSISETSTVTTAFTSLDMGPFATYNIDQKGYYSMTLGYNVKASGTYNDGTNAAVWTGTSMFFSFGVMPEVKEDFFVGFKLNYYSATYTKEVVTTTASDVSYTRSLVYPSFGVLWRH